MLARQLKNSATSTPRPRGSRRAFTLIELLISIAILGIGLAMAAAMLPAGMVANEHSAKDLNGTLLCQNGLAVARATLKHSTSPSVESPTDSGVFVDITNVFTEAERRRTYYPVIADDVAIDDAKPTSGFLLLGRRSIPSENIYQLVAVSYALSYDQAKSETESEAVLASVGGTINSANKKELTFSGTNLDKVRVGSPVIVHDASDEVGIGSFARILVLDGSVATLDVPLPENANSFWVVYERQKDDNTVIHPRSCGLTALSTITPLN